jgi:hypothetical protein
MYSRRPALSAFVRFQEYMVSSVTGLFPAIILSQKEENAYYQILSIHSLTFLPPDRIIF